MFVISKENFPFIIFLFLFAAFYLLFRVVPVTFFFFFLRAVPAAYGESQARAQIRAAAAGLCHSHSNTRFRWLTQPKPHLNAMQDL